MSKRAFFVASTGQHVGKTTTCLGLISGLKKRFKSVGFIKPVGQEHVLTDSGVRVDKDVLLFNETFDLPDPVETMSPVLFPRGFTRDFLDGKVDAGKLLKDIEKSFEKISKNRDLVVVEGTGHVGVGSICDLNNAIVAKTLGLDLIIIASGGLGSSFDAIAVNKALCDHVGLKIAGVILNRVLDDKREMIENYMQKALKRWNIPLLGSIPYDPFLSNPSIKDFENLFNATLLSGEKYHMRHFRHTRLIATPLETYLSLIQPSQLIITPSIREDIVHATIDYQKIHGDIEAGFILTGEEHPTPDIIKALKSADIPMLFAPTSSYKAMQMITSYTVKIQREDTEKIQEAINVVENHIDFDHLLKATNL